MNEIYHIGLDIDGIHIRFLYETPSHFCLIGFFGYVAPSRTYQYYKSWAEKLASNRSHLGMGNFSPKDNQLTLKIPTYKVYRLKSPSALMYEPSTFMYKDYDRFSIYKNNCWNKSTLDRSAYIIEADVTNSWYYKLPSNLEMSPKSLKTRLMELF